LSSKRDLRPIHTRRERAQETEPRGWGRHSWGLSTISPGPQRYLSGRRDDCAVDWSPVNKSKKTAAGAPASRTADSAETTGGTVGAVTAGRLPERRSREEKQQLELEPSNERGGAPAPPSAWLIRWLP
jgi:hypothetical protein